MTVLDLQRACSSSSRSPDVDRIHVEASRRASAESRMASLQEARRDPIEAAQVSDLRQDLASIQLQLQRLLAGQAEIQASVLRLSPVPLREAGEVHGSRSGEPMLAKVVSGKPGQSRPGFQSLQESVKQIKKTALQKLFKNAEDHERNRLLRRQKTGPKQVMKSWISSDHLEMTVDSIMAVIILLNAIFIGIASDVSDGSVAWTVVDVSFSLLFVVELVFKIGTHGIRHFTGPGLVMNCLDFVLITWDVVQLTVQLALAGSDNGPPASVFRMVRLVKIARVLRLANMDVFKDLLQMMQGMMGGMSTLFWAMIFFLLIVYVTALLFRELLGNRQDVPNVSEWFDSVPRAMFSTFRCSFGDCSTLSGQPIFEFVQQDMGTFYSLIYCLFVFSITIGLFNVISAIFVETTMEAAQKMAQEKKIVAHADERLLAARVTRLITCILKRSDQNADIKFTEAVDELFEIEVPRSVIDETIKDEEAKQVLDELDIHPQDRTRLSDIFDPDNGGTVALSDVAAGIRRLRGEPRRSDIVCVDLMIRTIQVQVGDTFQLVKAMAEQMGLQTPC